MAVKLARLVQRNELHSLRGKRLVVEGRLHGVQVVRANGNEGAATADVEVELVLKIEETADERTHAHPPVVDIVVHVDVTEHRTDDVGTNQLESNTSPTHTFVSLLTNILIRSCLGSMARYTYSWPNNTNHTGTSSVPIKMRSARDRPSMQSRSCRFAGTSIL